MVSEVQLDDVETASNVTTPSLNLTQEAAQAPEESPSHEAEVDPSSSENLLDEVILEEGEFEDPRESENYQMPPRRMVALFDYDPQALSPNPDSEVSREIPNFFSMNVIHLESRDPPLHFFNA